jgi:hypothetical protein
MDMTVCAMKDALHNSFEWSVAYLILTDLRLRCETISRPSLHTGTISIESASKIIENSNRKFKRNYCVDASLCVASNATGSPWFHVGILVFLLDILEIAVRPHIVLYTTVQYNIHKVLA